MKIERETGLESIKDHWTCSAAFAGLAPKCLSQASGFNTLSLLLSSIIFVSTVLYLPIWDRIVANSI